MSPPLPVVSKPSIGVGESEASSDAKLEPHVWPCPQPTITWRTTESCPVSCRKRSALPRMPRLTRAAAGVAADRDVARQSEREDQVDHDQPRDLSAGRDVAAPLEDEERAEDPED